MKRGLYWLLFGCVSLGCLLGLGYLAYQFIGRHGDANEEASSNTHATDAQNSQPSPVVVADTRNAAALGEEITPQVREINSPKFASPPNQFRPGQAQPKCLVPQMVQRTENGFVIKLPSGAPVPTPTIYHGKLYVSGGFHSREYYCFDATTGQPVWAVSLSDDGPSSAVCSDDIVVLNTESCTLFALDAKTGQHLWSYWLGDPMTSTPALSDGIVFTSYPARGHALFGPQTTPQDSALIASPAFGSAPGKLLSHPQTLPGSTSKPPLNATHVLIALELKTGKILWQRWLDSDVMSAPVVKDEDVYATSFAGTVYRFRKKDGAIVSAHATRATSAPVLLGQNLLITQRLTDTQDNGVAEQLLAQDLRNNAQLFAAAKQAALYLDPNIQLRSALQDQGKALDAANGFMAGPPVTANASAALANVGQGTVFTMQNFQGSRILPYQGNLYSAMGDALVCVDGKSGQTQWRLPIQGDLMKEGGHLAAPPAAAGGYIFLATLSGEVLQINPDDGKVAKRYQVGAPIRSQPVIYNGRIYVGTMNGQVVCIDTGDPRCTGWYAWGANMAHTNIPES